jgi:copper resistance protein B
MTDRRARLASVSALLLAAGVAAAEVPPVTPEERAAAFPDVSGTDMHAHMDDDPLLGSLAVDELEWRKGPGDDSLHWDATGWIGRDANRLWLRAEGERAEGGRAENRLELLWGRPVAPWWDLLAGLRHDTGEGPSRTYAVLGVQGTTPQWLHLDATACFGERGQSGLRVEGQYEWLLTNRLVLAARAEGEAWGRDDAANGIGSGFSDWQAGLRLRYEIRRKFAPYAGAEWSGLAGDTADFAREAGGDVRDTRVVAGVRFWF